MRDRGFTLIETLVTVAIAAMLLLGALTLSAGLRPAAVSTSSAQFDAAVANARSLAAASGNGATLVITAATAGTSLQLYAGRPTQAGALSSAAPPVTISASVREATLGAPPFTIFFDSTAHASGTQGAITPATVLSSDPGCPGGGTSMSLTFSDVRASVTRTLPCLQTTP